MNEQNERSVVSVRERVKFNFSLRLMALELKFLLY